MTQAKTRIVPDPDHFRILKQNNLLLDLMVQADA